jgi:hypothetical protein
MRKLLILTALALMTAGTTGCFHNNTCGGLRGGLFGSRQPAPAALPCCPQQVQCCDPCAGVTVSSPIMSAPMAAPMAAPCCP